MQKINLNKITEIEIEERFSTPRLDKMFWTIRNYSFNDIPSYEVKTILDRLGFDFAVSSGNGSGSIYVRDLKSENKWIFWY